MQSIRSKIVYSSLKILGSPFDSRKSLGKQRATMEKQSKYLVMPPGVEVKPVYIKDMYAEWIQPQGKKAAGALLYLHGGGYTMGSCDTHRALVSHISISCQVPALLINYRLAPENPFPAALDDALAAYRWLMHDSPEGGNVIIAGDSAGGGLALALGLTINKAREKLPKGIVCISPWADLTMAGETVKTCAKTDPLINLETSRFHASRYAPQQDLTSPLISPVYADLHGFPPLLIQVGEYEILLSDSLRLSENAQHAGVEVIVEVWERMWHVWHMFAGLMPESQKAINRIGTFVNERINA